MSHHSDDAMLIAGSDSFWEPGNYKKTTKRAEDGSKLCTDLTLLIKERADIEQNYAKSLRTWSQKWNQLIEKGPEYGTTEAAWKAVLAEAERRCDLHTRVKDHLIQTISTQIKQWQKDNFHKSMMQMKEKKEFDDAFKKAQKPWAKLLTKVNKCKLDYHNACKNERTAINQERNASGDTSLSPDQVKKLQDRVTKSKEEVIKTKEKYEAALREINDYNAKYMEDMTVVFEKCQEFEEKRLNFVKEMLFAIHGCLNLSQVPELPQIYEEYRHTIQNAAADKDLKWWSNNFGVGMAMNWPQFEEYCEEFRDIIGKTKKSTSVPENGIQLVNQQKFNEELPEYTPELNNISKKEKKLFSEGLNANDITLLDHRMDIHKNSVNNGHKIEMPIKRINHQSNGKQEANPFDDDHEDWDDYPNDALVDTGEAGVPVRALYDYNGAEADELTFKQGDVFEKLEDEDEQGWCKGRKDGRVGLYPANYIEIISN
ncbi:unnamed protein product [Medioppia subpectinata]|uniref:Protein kinase C and casein kinase substrate in neurons protein 2 n=1 Tax=Medioppia subpectinata TaxID=1979941 RepID=A0A7R9KJG4_9ACAR|nr:unnamed protein product [Medioppia subpectinata]CAG2104620.1 unnamed protein product [Medioppia subpectinata]